MARNNSYLTTSIGSITDSLHDKGTQGHLITLHIIYCNKNWTQGMCIVFLYDITKLICRFSKTWITAEILNPWKTDWNNWVSVADPDFSKRAFITSFLPECRTLWKVCCFFLFLESRSTTISTNPWEIVLNLVVYKNLNSACRNLCSDQMFCLNVNSRHWPNQLLNNKSFFPDRSH